jgi:hypothetical protein
MKADIVYSAPGWKLAKKSPLPLVPVTLLPEAYNINWFSYSLAEFFRNFYRREVEISNTGYLEVFPKATQIINDAFASDLVDRVHASPARAGGPITSRFDTVLIYKGSTSRGEDFTRPSYGISRES